MALLRPEDWEAIRDVTILGAHHKSFESITSSSPACISRVFVGFAVVVARALCPRQTVCFDVDWVGGSKCVIGYRSSNDDFSGLVVRLINATESVTTQSREAYERECTGASKGQTDYSCSCHD